MTPKEKADDIYYRFDTGDKRSTIFFSLQCVEYIINSNPTIPYMDAIGSIHIRSNKLNLEYWEQVREELNKR